MKENKLKVLWISVPEQILEDDNPWIYESQKKSHNPEQIVRNFILRHPEILEHPKIQDQNQDREMRVVGVELGLLRPDTSEERPDVLFSKGKVYYVIAAKWKFEGEPELKNEALGHYEALKHTLETTGEPFDRIIPVVVVGDESIEQIRSLYHDSRAMLEKELEQAKRKQIVHYPSMFRDEG